MVLTVVPWLMQMISLSAAPVVVDLIVYCIYAIPLLYLIVLLLIPRKPCVSEPVKDSKKITLDQVQLKYYETIRHLGNFF